MAAAQPADGSGKMFDGIAQNYDLLNRINSLGLDQSWRRRAVASLMLPPAGRVLDLATGTGDLMLMLSQHCQEVVGLDPSSGMLSLAERKLKQAGLEEKTELVFGDAQDLPFEDNSFDGITMAFGIRNVPNRALALKEMARVLKPGARVAILELSEPKSGIVSALARIHVHHLVPLVGAALSGKEAYRYLQTSIESFPSPESFEQLMADSGLQKVERVSFAFGASVLYVGTPREEK